MFTEQIISTFPWNFLCFWQASPKIWRIFWKRVACHKGGFSRRGKQWKSASYTSSVLASSMEKCVQGTRCGFSWFPLQPPALYPPLFIKVPCPFKATFWHAKEAVEEEILFHELLLSMMHGKQAIDFFNIFRCMEHWEINCVWYCELFYAKIQAFCKPQGHFITFYFSYTTYHLF